MPRVSHFDILLMILSVRKNFTQKFLIGNLRNGMVQWIIGWQMEQKNQGSMEDFQKVPGQIGMTNTISVPSVDFSNKITENGGELIIPKMAIPGVGWFCSMYRH